MRKYTLVALSLVVLTSGLAWAGPRFAGTVVRLDSKSGLVVVQTKGGLKKFQIDSKAHIERNGAGSSLSAFKPGDSIQIEIAGPMDDPVLHGVAVYDNATAASLPMPAAPSGVYGMPHGDIATAGGVAKTGNPINVAEGIGDGGATDQNLAYVQNQALTTNPYGGPMNPNNPYAPQYQYNANSPYGSPYQAIPPGGGPVQAPATGWSTQPPGAPAQSAPAGSAPATGWSSQPPGVPSGPPPTTNNGPGWSSNPYSPHSTTGWSAGVQNQATSFDGLIRNIEPSRGLVFVAPMTGGTTVAVKVGIYTQITSAQNQTLPFANLQPGSAVHVAGSMAGNVFTATAINVAK